jgi:hypothetical protein
MHNTTTSTITAKARLKHAPEWHVSLSDFHDHIVVASVHRAQLYVAQTFLKVGVIIAHDILLCIGFI